MKCSHCGLQISNPSGKFCPRCGTALLARTQKMGSARLLIREAGIEREVILDKSVLTIGRDPSNDIDVGIPSPSNPFGLRAISRKQARLISVGNGYAIEDLGSANGTFVRGQKLSSSRPIPLSDGDIVRIGDG